MYLQILVMRKMALLPYTIRTIYQITSHFYCFILRSEYWKSNPRKFCDFCKCWIADNKPSVEFHERGKRHKESVQKRLDEIGKKGKEDHENKLKENDYMREMEEAALKAYKKDIENNPDFTGVKIAELAEASNAKIVIGSKPEEPKGISSSKPKKESSKGKKKTTKPTTPKIKKKWHEAETPEGQSYYWNTETGESVWEVPKDGFVSLLEQRNIHSVSGTSTKSKKSVVESSVPTYGPMPKNDPYGSWESAHQTVEEVNLQLPSVSEQEYYAPELIIRRPEVSFKEKVVSISKEDSFTGPITFKKRKSGEAHKKNAKQRIED